MTTACNFTAKQHTLWGQILISLGTVAAVYNTILRGDFTPSMGEGPGG